MPEGHRLLVSGVGKPSLNLSHVWELKDDHAVLVLLALDGRDGLTASEELAAILFHRRWGAVGVLAIGQRIVDRHHGDDIGRHGFPPWCCGVSAPLAPRSRDAGAGDFISDIGAGTAFGIRLTQHGYDGFAQAEDALSRGFAGGPAEDYRRGAHHAAGV